MRVAMDRPRAGARHPQQAAIARELPQRLGGIRSVIVPSAISAAKPTVSDSVGCGWMVRPRSLGVGAHLEGERDLGDQLAGVDADDAGAEDPVGALVDDQLGEALRAAEPTAPGRRRAQGKTRLARTRCRRPWPRVSVSADPGDLGVGVGDRRGSTRGVEDAMCWPGDRPRRRPRPRGSPCGRASARRRRRRWRRCAATLVRMLLVDRDEAALVHLHARGLGADAPRRWAGGPTATRTRSKRPALGRPSSPSKVTRRPVLRRLDRGDLGAEVDRLVALLDPLRAAA